MSADYRAQEQQRRNVVAAVMAGVTAYMEEQDRAIEPASRRRREAVAAKLWPVLGREEIMRMRTMWQRRMV